MPPEQRVVPRFAAEPPQDALPYGRWAQRLATAMRAAWEGLAGEAADILERAGADSVGEGKDVGGGHSLGGGGDVAGEPSVDLGEPGEIVWYPDRRWGGWTYLPATCLTSTGYELFGHVRYTSGGEAAEPEDLVAEGDFTAHTAARNPHWRLDVCDQAVGLWRGRGGTTATMTLVWGQALVGRGAVATAELGGVTVDQCELIEGRFTLIAPDDYQDDLLEIVLWDARGRELARESLYED